MGSGRSYVEREDVAREGKGSGGCSRTAWYHVGSERIYLFLRRREACLWTWDAIRRDIVKPIQWRESDGGQSCCSLVVCSIQVSLLAGTFKATFAKHEQTLKCTFRRLLPIDKFERHYHHHQALFAFDIHRYLEFLVRSHIRRERTCPFSLGSPGFFAQPLPTAES